jgi:hypothetical protein
MVKFEVELKGDWAPLRKALMIMGRDTRSAQRRALKEEAEFIRKKIVEGIRTQAPGGQRFKPLSPLTLAMRQFLGIKGDKALIEREDLIHSITVLEQGPWAVTVGIAPDAVNSEGRSLAQIATIQEKGADYHLPLTERMRRYLAMVYRKMGVEQGSQRGGSSSGTIHIVIPARPFLAPVYEQHVKGAGFERRIGRRFIAALRIAGLVD